MQEHPVPQNVTSFEFKLIGDMTLRQFGFVGSGLAFALIIFFAISANRELNIVLRSFGWFLIVLSSLGGFALAFIPVEGRALDRWLVSFFKAVFGNTLYVWKKEGVEYDILEGMGNVEAVTAQPVNSQLSYDATKAPQSTGQPKNALDEDELRLLEKIRQTSDHHEANLPPITAIQPTTPAGSALRLPPLPHTRIAPQGYAGPVEPPKTIPSPLAATSNSQAPAKPNTIRFPNQRPLAPRLIPFPSYQQPMPQMMPAQMGAPGMMQQQGPAMPVTPYQPMPQPAPYLETPMPQSWPPATTMGPMPAMPQTQPMAQMTPSPALSQVPMPPLPPTLQPLSQPVTPPQPGAPAPNQSPIPVTIVSAETPVPVAPQQIPAQLEVIKKQNEELEQKLRELEGKMLATKQEEQAKEQAIKAAEEASYQAKLKEMEDKLSALTQEKVTQEQALHTLQESSSKPPTPEPPKPEEPHNQMASMQSELEKMQIAAMVKTHEKEMAEAQQKTQTPRPVEPIPVTIVSSMPVVQQLQPSQPLETPKPVPVTVVEPPKPPLAVAPAIPQFKPPTQAMPEPAPKAKPDLPLHPSTPFSEKTDNQPKQPAPFNMDLPAITKVPNAISGYVLDETNMPLADTIIVVKKADGPTVRALKSNRIGQFSIVTPLADGHYELIFEKDGYNFDIITIDAKGDIIPPIKISGRKSL